MRQAYIFSACFGMWCTILVFHLRFICRKTKNYLLLFHLNSFHPKNSFKYASVLSRFHTLVGTHLQLHVDSHFLCLRLWSSMLFSSEKGCKETLTILPGFFRRHCTSSKPHTIYVHFYSDVATTQTMKFCSRFFSIILASLLYILSTHGILQKPGMEVNSLFSTIHSKPKLP